jgi:LysM repeat protein
VESNFKEPVKDNHTFVDDAVLVSVGTGPTPTYGVAGPTETFSPTRESTLISGTTNTPSPLLTGTSGAIPTREGTIVAASTDTPPPLLLTNTSASIPQTTKTPPPGTVIYVVAAGDTLSGIAARFGVTVETLASANGLDPNGLMFEGQRLVIPPSLNPTSAPSHTPTVSVASATAIHVTEQNTATPRLETATATATLAPPTSTPTTVATAVALIPTSSQPIVFFDNSGQYLGDGTLTVLAPQALHLGETGEVRAEIKLNKISPVLTLNPPPTATPDLSITRVAPTPLPEQNRGFILVHERMGAELQGINLANFDVQPVEPSGILPIDPNAINYWKWNITAKDTASLGLSTLNVYVYYPMRTNGGDLYKSPASSLNFYVEITKPFDVGSFFDTTVGRIAALAGAITAVAGAVAVIWALRRKPQSTS